MAQLPWSEFVRDMGDVLEQEVDSLVAAARRKAIFHASRDDDVIRLTLEVAVGSAIIADADDVRDAIEAMRAERDEALRALDAANGAQAVLASSAEGAGRRRAAAQSALRRARARIKELEETLRLAAEAAASRHVSAEVGGRADLEEARIGRAAAEASLAMLERAHAQVRLDLAHARESAAATEKEVSALRDLNADLQAEIAELWRVLRDTRPGEPLSIMLQAPPADADGRREGVERVQAKIIDARERFKRRSHRWPIAI
ncbi:MAG TPA: hypothetical protein VH951_04860 [Dehalococcoidia bacterium]|jgi:chromosome segregation ATPase